MEQKVIHVLINDYKGEKKKNGKIITIFGHRYRLRESARKKYMLLGNVWCVTSVLICFYMVYCALFTML